ncbi:hypothetical protein J2Z17_005071 [Rhizobium halophytocola]|uniref:Uncharacterized protein n=1 Tax=Rhizobium halophytocola TaxID=735519 RepID=A0ABS4E6M9_9HYPH|nr:hypothetical protein [Rhizobium halophytocola]
MDLLQVSGGFLAGAKAAFNTKNMIYVGLP